MPYNFDEFCEFEEKAEVLGGAHVSQMGLPLDRAFLGPVERNKNLEGVSTACDELSSVENYHRIFILPPNGIDLEIAALRISYDTSSENDDPGDDDPGDGHSTGPDYSSQDYPSSEYSDHPSSVSSTFREAFSGGNQNDIVGLGQSRLPER
ncbi:hypothetical protein G7Y89_g1303 [Cudoniella acicularis]|uniref:Uncharacterized protein n=1 Tax=Cudoniella acicularis TaxID=354080 RepID=A0A8H4W7K3_9HELO|nr:hypothetical protein G7Y89_g1303 [Cudoniella acicularis]